MVIAIIAVLASLLLPALNQARNSVKTTACSSNLRQIGVATAGYEGDYGIIYWPSQAPYSGSTASALTWDGLLIAAKSMTSKTLRCPSDSIKRLAGFYPRSYFVNGPTSSNDPNYLGSGAANASSPLGKRSSNIKSPSTKVLQLCQPYKDNFASRDYCIAKGSGNSKHYYITEPGFAHGPGAASRYAFTNVLLCDMHVEKWPGMKFEASYSNANWYVDQ